MWSYEKTKSIGYPIQRLAYLNTQVNCIIIFGKEEIHLTGFVVGDDQ